MNRLHSDVVVHVRDPLGAGVRRSLYAAIAAFPGVAGTRTHPRAGRLVIVDYDRTEIAPREILRRIAALGFSASLVGM